MSVYFLLFCYHSTVYVFITTQVPWSKITCRVIDWLISNWVQTLAVPMHLGLKNGPFVPHNLIADYGSPVPLVKFQMAPSLRLLISSGSKKEEPRCLCLSEAKATHLHRTWAEVSPSALHLPHKGLSISPIKLRCLLMVLCPVRRPVTTLDTFRVKMY